VEGLDLFRSCARSEIVRPTFKTRLDALALKLGMNVSAAASRLFFVQPVLPNFLDTVQINKLRVGAASVDIPISRRAQHATVEIERREGHVELMTEAWTDKNKGGLLLFRLTDSAELSTVLILACARHITCCLHWFYRQSVWVLQSFMQSHSGLYSGQR
jgi:hypothetical protein